MDGQLAATFIVSMAMEQGKTKTFARAIMTHTWATGMGQAVTNVCLAGACRPVQSAMKHTWERVVILIASLPMLSTVTNLTEVGVNTQWNLF